VNANISAKKTFFFARKKVLSTFSAKFLMIEENWPQNMSLE